MEVSVLCSHGQWRHSRHILEVYPATVPEQQHQDVDVADLGRLMHGCPLLPANLVHPGAMSDQCVRHLVRAGPHRCKVREKGVSVRMKYGCMTNHQRGIYIIAFLLEAGSLCPFFLRKPRPDSHNSLVLVTAFLHGHRKCFTPNFPTSLKADWPPKCSETALHTHYL